MRTLASRHTEGVGEPERSEQHRGTGIAIYQLLYRWRLSGAVFGDFLPLQKVTRRAGAKARFQDSARPEGEHF